MSDTKANDICRQMSALRCSLGDDVEQFVDSARTLSDWRHYVRYYPWLCLAGAVAAGYWAVPKRLEIISPSADAMEELAKRNKLVVKANPEPQERRGMAAAVFGLLASVAVRGVMNYAGQRAGKLFNQTPANTGGSNGKSTG